MHGEKVIISGIGPGHHGVSQLVEYFQRNYTITVLCPKKSLSLRRSRQSIIAWIVVVAQNLIYKSIFTLRLTAFIIFNKKVPIILHHHSLGFIFLAFVLLRKKFDYFCVDSSFMCLKSYNFSENRECINCLEYFRPLKECRPFPSVRSRFFHKLIRALFVKKQKNIKFYCQNELQAQLVRKTYPLAQIKVVGMIPNDFLKELKLNNNRVNHKSNGSSQYYIFHGSAIPAKGFPSLVQTEGSMELAIIFPFSRQEAIVSLKKCGIRFTDFPNNWIFKPLRWNTGLKELCMTAKGVFVFSQWSSPIEGALFKSMVINRNVIVAETRYGFPNDLPDGLVWIASKNLTKIDYQISNTQQNIAIDRSSTMQRYLNGMIEQTKHQISQEMF